jgi:glycerol-3-phosphate cytidylyltransferase-like family protein
MIKDDNGQPIKVALNAAIADCFHEGHYNLYKAMSETGRWVAVVVHDDLSCYKIKKKFPVQRLEHRMSNLRMSGLVDEVEVTNDIDPADMFESVISIYGAENVEYFRGDDLIENFPGKWKLDQHRIKINYLPYTKGVSSSQIRAEICT